MTATALPADTALCYLIKPASAAATPASLLALGAISGPLSRWPDMTSAYREVVADLEKAANAVKEWADSAERVANWSPLPATRLCANLSKARERFEEAQRSMCVRMGYEVQEGRVTGFRLSYQGQTLQITLTGNGKGLLQGMLPPGLALGIPLGSWGGTVEVIVMGQHEYLLVTDPQGLALAIIDAVGQTGAIVKRFDDPQAE